MYHRIHIPTINQRVKALAPQTFTTFFPRTIIVTLLLPAETKQKKIEYRINADFF